MKKTLSMLLLVLFAVGLLVSCNADAVEELFQKDNPPVSTTYTVTFDIQGHGEQITSYSNVVSGATVSAPPAPTADGFIFYGWYQEAECTNKWNFDTDEVTGNITLYARWVESTIAGILSTVEGFPISSNQGAAPDNAWTAVNGNKCYRTTDSLCFIPTTMGLKGVGISANVVKSGNDYICNPQVGLTVTFHMTGDVLTSITFTGNSTFEGTYTAPVTHTVTFDLNGINCKQSFDPQSVVSGNIAKAPSPPTDPTETHTFAGWYMTKDDDGKLTNQWNFNNPVTADMTLYAKWTRTLGSIYGTNENVPKADNNTAPDNAWVNDDGGKAFIAYSGKTSEELYFYKKLEPSGAKQLPCRKTENFTKIGDDYVLVYEVSSKPCGVFTLHMTGGKFTSVTYNGTGTDYAVLSGTYFAPTN